MVPPKCLQCGALIDPLALACPYCRFTTPAGIAAKQREEHEARVRAQWAEHAQHQHQIAGSRRLDSTATQSLIWSIVGTLLCCLPVGVVGIVMGVRARTMAAQAKVDVPAKATVGLVLGIFSCVSSLAFFTYAMISSSMAKDDADERISAIEKRIGTKSSSAVLDRDTACGLAEIHARQRGWAGNEGYTLEHFECVGKLTTHADEAELEDFRFQHHSVPYQLHACFKRGGTWYVSEMTDGECFESGKKSRPGL